MKKIIAAAAYDVMDNGLEVITNLFPPLICQVLRIAYRNRWGRIINWTASLICKKSILADWALSQGMNITGTKTVYDFFQNISKHNLDNIVKQFSQEILLLAGEKDHYIPSGQFYRLQKNIHSTKSVTYRLFTAEESGEQHCQIGNHMIAINTILNWLDDVFADKN